ncbi:MAG: hypothetical protein WBQ37_05860 [Candidatus Competibacter sp.]
MNFETRIAKLEDRHGPRDNSDLFAVRLMRWLTTTPWTVIYRECGDGSGLLDLAARLRELPAEELARQLHEL